MNSRREFLQTATLGALGLATRPSAGQGTKQTSSQQPNIIFLLADDMGYSDLGCYGSEIDTPHLDRLAKGGLRFSQFYNSPRCCPSRASLLTGLYSHQVGFGMMTADYGRYPFPAYKGDLSENCVTLPEALKRGGYTTLMTGKWHLTPLEDTTRPNLDKHNWPLQRGFDRFYGIIAGAANYYDPASLVRDNTPIREEAANFYLTDAIADNAVTFLEETSKKGSPFFLYTAFNAPHWPLQAPESAVAKFRERYKQGWDTIRADRYAAQLQMGLVDRKWTKTDRDLRVPAWSRASFQEWEVERMAVYAAQVHLMDAAIGRIVSKLEALGQLNNTLIFFMSDNGGNHEEMGRQDPNAARPIYIAEKTKAGEPVVPGNFPNIMPGPANTFQSYGGPWGNVSNTPFRLYKHFTHEGGISTPLIAHWPNGIAARGSITRQVGHEIDILPTCLAVSGIPYPTHTKAGSASPLLEGRSLVAPFRDAPIPDRGMLFWEHEGNCAVRDGKWKLVSAWPNNWELYDMDADRTETHNIADQHPDQFNRMAAAYRNWAKRVGAQPWPMPTTPANQRTGSLPLPDYLKKDRP